MLRPTVAHELFDGKVEVLIYGKSTDELGQSQVVEIAVERGIKDVYHPQTHTFNGKICRPADFVPVIKKRGVKIHSGCLTDGVVLDSPKSAAWLRTADCPTIVTRQDLAGEVIAAHAGRASLIDEELVRTGQASRHPESVVQKIYERLIDFGRQTLIELEVYSCCGIGPMQFRHPADHPLHGPFNAKMNRHIALTYGSDCFLDGQTACGALNLHRLIHNQFHLGGVPLDNIHHDEVDTARDRARFFSRRGGDQIGYNTILVIRHN